MYSTTRVSYRQITSSFLVAILVGSFYGTACSQVDDKIGREEHVMIPMRDAQSLSAYLYFPEGSGPWPAIFEQRYASIRDASTRKAATLTTHLCCQLTTSRTEASIRPI